MDFFFKMVYCCHYFVFGLFYLLCISAESNSRLLLPLMDSALCIPLLVGGGFCPVLFCAHRTFSDRSVSLRQRTSDDKYEKPVGLALKLLKTGKTRTRSSLWGTLSLPKLVHLLSGRSWWRSQKQNRKYGNSQEKTAKC